MKRNVKKWITMGLAIALMGTTIACSSGSGEGQSSSAGSDLEENSSDAAMTYSEESSSDAAETYSEENSSDVTVAYSGEAFTKSILAVGGSSLYVCGVRDEEYFFGYMEQEGDSFQEFSLDAGDGMRAYQMYVDSDNQCHILWFATERVSINGQELEAVSYEKSCITVIDRAGNILQNIDTTDFFLEEQAIPVSFVADRKGNYWFGEGAQLVSVSSDGTLNEKVECPGVVENVGIGTAGLIYAIYHEQDGSTRYLGNILPDGLFYFEDQLTDEDSGYACMGPGAGGVDLLIYHQTAGAFGTDRNTRKQVIKEEQLPITGEDVNGYGFLADGRLCLMSSGENGTRMFYYIHTTGFFL